MNGDLVSLLLWSFLTILAMLLSVIFGYVYRKDRDKRKSMFMLAFAFASLSFLRKMQTEWESIQIMERLYYWSSLPIISAVLIAVLSSFLKLEDFDKPLKAFLFALATSIFMIVVPLPVQPARSLLFQGMSMIVIVVSIYLILTRREIPGVMFLLSMVCFISSGLGMARGLGVEFSVFAYVFAYVFIALVFVTSKESVKGSVSSFFALKRKLEKTQEELRESEEKYRKQFEEAMDAIIVADAETGIIIDCNRAASELVGREKSELVGKHQRILHPSQEIEGGFSRTFKQHLKEKEGQVLETQVITKKGEIKEVAIKANLFELRGKKMIQGIFRDITERKKTERAVRESRQKFERLFIDNPEAAIYVGADFHILDVNPRFEETFGYSLGEIKGKHINDVVVPKDKMEEAGMLDKKAEKAYVYHDTVRKRKDESLVPVSISAAQITVEDQLIGYVILYKDIAERKQMEKKLEEYSQHLGELVEKRTRQLKEAQERLLKAERLAAIGELATMVGHDLRNPLQSIENATYYVNNELSRLSSSVPITQKAKEMLQVISDSVNYADGIIRDLQDFSAARKPMLEKTNINAIVKETLSRVEVSENVELITELGHLPEIEADKDQIKRVFLNLAANGIEAMENGGRLKVSTKKTRDFVEVSFEDTGVGMPKENMEKLFTPFFSTKAKGLGMGLAICKKFVESHGGSIDVESEEGEGSTFTVKLPIK